MAGDTNGTRKKVDFKTLCIAHDKEMNKDIVVYRFSKGKRFYEKAKKPSGYGT